MSQINTEELVRQAKNGDKAAFDALYREYSEQLTKYVMKLGLNEYDAQDIVSDTFMTAMKSIGQLNEDKYFSTWLHAIANNKVNEMRRKSSKHKRVGISNADPDDDTDSDAAIERAYENAYGDTVMLPENYAENEEIKQMIAEQINTLSDAHKETLFLFYYGNKSAAEIAEITGTNENNVKARLFHARKNLKAKLEKLQKQGVVLCAVPFIKLVPDYSHLMKVGKAAEAGAAASTAAGAAKAATAGIGLKAVAVAAAAVITVGIGAVVLPDLLNDKQEDDKGRQAAVVIDDSKEKPEREYYKMHIEDPDHHDEYMESVSQECLCEYDRIKAYTLESDEAVEDEEYTVIGSFDQPSVYNAFDNGYAYLFRKWRYDTEDDHETIAFFKTEDGVNWSPIPLDGFSVKSSELNTSSPTTYKADEYYVTLKGKLKSEDPSDEFGSRLFGLDSGAGIYMQYDSSDADSYRMDITGLTWAAVIPDEDHNIRLIEHDGTAPEDNFLYGLQLNDGTVYDGSYEVEIEDQEPLPKTGTGETATSLRSDMTDEEYNAYIEERKALEKEKQKEINENYEAHKNDLPLKVYRKSDGELIYEGPISLDPETLRPATAPADAAEGSETFIPAGMPDLDVEIINDREPEPVETVHTLPDHWRENMRGYVQENIADSDWLSVSLFNVGDSVVMDLTYNAGEAQQMSQYISSSPKADVVLLDKNDGHSECSVIPLNELHEMSTSRMYFAAKDGSAVYMVHNAYSGMAVLQNYIYSFGSDLSGFGDISDSTLQQMAAGGYTNGIVNPEDGTFEKYYSDERGFDRITNVKTQYLSSKAELLEFIDTADLNDFLQ